MASHQTIILTNENRVPELENHNPSEHNISSEHNITGTVQETNAITKYFRISRIIVHTLVGFFIAGLILPLSTKAARLKLVSWWCRHLLAAFNIRLTCQGDIPSSFALTNTMFIGNHISWADIHALNSVVPVRFIAKSEIKDWPVFGYLAKKANALFIDRSKRHDAARIVDVTVQSLQAGDNLCLFPEGTTTDGTKMKPFKSSLIQAAIEAEATIWPVVIRYPRADGSVNTDVAYAGETTLPESMQAVLSQKYPVVELTFLRPIDVKTLKTKDRRALTQHLEQLIRSELKL
jgi:1-acyl-sn-glycerol-3-phosphate acyltransferase